MPKINSPISYLKGYIKYEEDGTYDTSFINPKNAIANSKWIKCAVSSQRISVLYKPYTVIGFLKEATNGKEPIVFTRTLSAYRGQLAYGFSPGSIYLRDKDRYFTMTWTEWKKAINTLQIEPLQKQAILIEQYLFRKENLAEFARGYYKKLYDTLPKDVTDKMKEFNIDTILKEQLNKYKNITADKVSKDFKEKLCKTINEEVQRQLRKRKIIAIFRVIPKIKKVAKVAELFFQPELVFLQVGTKIAKQTITKTTATSIGKKATWSAKRVKGYKTKFDKIKRL